MAEELEAFVRQLIANSGIHVAPGDTVTVKVNGDEVTITV